MSSPRNSKRILFQKLHGLGNDFVLIDGIGNPGLVLTKKTILELADRKRGVGYDQLLFLQAPVSPKATAKMVIYNTDGSIAEMCGNGLRAAALYLWKVDSRLPQTIFIDTHSGLRSASRLSSLDEGVIETEMGAPQFKEASAQLLKAATWMKTGVKASLVDVGNPHAVFLIKPPASPEKPAPFEKLHKSTLEWLTTNGALIENHKNFPNRTNVEFIEIKNRKTIYVYVWERGVGLTEACGTGAVAAATAAMKLGLCDKDVKVVFPGGIVEVSWDAKKKNASAFLRGTAHHSFSGEFLL